MNAQHERKRLKREPVLYLSGRNLGTYGAMVIRHYIQSNRALVKFDISNNGLKAAGGKALAQALKDNKVMQELNISSNDLGYDSNYDSDISGVIAISNAIPTMRALTSLDMSNNNIGLLVPPEGWTSEDNDGQAPWIHSDGRRLEEGVTEGSQPEGAIAICNAISTSGALVKFDISANIICAEGGRLLAAALKDNHIMTDLNIANNSLGKESSDWDAKADISGVVAISNAIPTMGALTTLNISTNSLCAAGGKALAEALTGNQVLASLNISDNWLDRKKAYSNLEYGWNGKDLSGVVAISNAIPTMGALEKLLMAKNKMGTTKSGKALGMALSKNTVLKELDVSDNKYFNNGWKTDPGFASEIANGINNNGAIATVNIMGNNIGKEQVSKLKDMITAHPTLVSLCGIADNATEVDLSGLQMNASDAAILADELPAKRALTSLDISNNNIGQIVGWTDCGPLSDSEACGSAYSEAPDNHRYIHTDGRHQAELLEGDELGKPEGFIAIVNAIPTMGKIAYLNIRRNGRLDEAAYEALRNMWKTCMTKYAFDELPSIKTDTPMDEEVNSYKAFFACCALPGRTNTLRNLRSERGLLINIVEYLL